MHLLIGCQAPPGGPDWLKHIVSRLLPPEDVHAVNVFEPPSGGRALLHAALLVEVELSEGSDADKLVSSPELETLLRALEAMGLEPQTALTRRPLHELNIPD